MTNISYLLVYLQQDIIPVTLFTIPQSVNDCGRRSAVQARHPRGTYSTQFGGYVKDPDRAVIQRLNQCKSRPITMETIAVKPLKSFFYRGHLSRKYFLMKEIPWGFDADRGQMRSKVHRGHPGSTRIPWSTTFIGKARTAAIIWLMRKYFLSLFGEIYHNTLHRSVVC